MTVSFRPTACPHGTRPAGNFRQQKQGMKHHSKAAQGRCLICCFLCILATHRHVEWPSLGASGFFFLADAFSVATAKTGTRMVSRKAGNKEGVRLSTPYSISGRTTHDSSRHSQLVMQDQFIHTFQLPLSIFLSCTEFLPSSHS